MQRVVVLPVDVDDRVAVPAQHGRRTSRRRARSSSRTMESARPTARREPSGLKHSAVIQPSFVSTWCEHSAAVAGSQTIDARVVVAGREPLAVAGEGERPDGRVVAGQAAEQLAGAAGRTAAARPGCRRRPPSRRRATAACRSAAAARRAGSSARGGGRGRRRPRRAGAWSVPPVTSVARVGGELRRKRSPMRRASRTGGAVERRAFAACRVASSTSTTPSTTPPNASQRPSGLTAARAVPPATLLAEQLAVAGGRVQQRRPRGRATRAPAGAVAREARVAGAVEAAGRSCRC